MKYYKILILGIFLFSINLAAQDFSKIINSALKELIKEEKPNAQDVHWRISSQHISSTSNIQHIYYNQTINGIQINGTESSIHLLSTGEVLTSHNNFIINSSSKVQGNNTPSISAIDAIVFIAKEFKYSISTPLKVIDNYKSEDKNTLISSGGISKNNIPANLVYIKGANDHLILCWKVSILENSQDHWWDIYVDATTGSIRSKRDKVFTCSIENSSHKSINNNTLKIKYNTAKKNAAAMDCENCYEVIQIAKESPYYGERVIISNPIDYYASPLGWHRDGDLPTNQYTFTKGNNIYAYIGNEDNFEYKPYGTGYLNFTNYLFDQNFNGNNRYENASITNLFYWGNVIHDVLYQYGFNELSGNFQTNNFNKGGEENDFISILGQKDLNLCNASIGISKDGVKPFIAINACGNKDGAFDNIVLIHEYLHGVSFRLTGGANSDNCLEFGEQMTEGWSDWYALMMTMSSNDVATTPRGIATYLFDQGENGNGIRLFPYTTDMNINPQTYDFIKINQGTHDVGSVWAAILWELTWNLIEEYGFDENIYNFSGNLNLDAGNIIALAIVTEGMKLQPCTPGFIDGRDAILNAYHSIYGWENDCIIWEAFAKRGLGFSAAQGSSYSLDDGTESFDMPSPTANFDRVFNNVCLNSNVIFGLGGGQPQGGVYSGTGVTDDGNGLTFSFNPSVAGAGSHTVYYEVFDTFCSEASIDEAIIEVAIDETPPVITCFSDMVVTISSDEDGYIVPDFSSNVLVSDNCLSAPTITQTPAVGINIGVGDTVITMASIDGIGNEANCTFMLTIEREEKEEQAIKFEVYPNPSNGELILYSSDTFEMLTASIFDLSGKLIKKRIFNDFGLAKSINIAEISTGMYFIKIEANNFSTTKRLLKD